MSRCRKRASPCGQCHKVSNKGKPFGPELTDVRKRLKWSEVVRAIVEPSHAITKGFDTQVIVTVEGEVVSGLVVAEDDEVVKVVDNPLKRDAPTEIPRARIASRQASALSLMPAGLLNTYTAEEVLELLIFLQAAGDKEHVLYGR
jgi:putative heme-binding domain-containing protein